MMQTIMVVDDSATIRQVASLCLRQAGYQVVEAIDGSDALAKLKYQMIQFLLTDLYMPQIDGIELTRQVRSMPQYLHIPVLMMTTETQTLRKKEGQSAGVSAWFVKPFDPIKLVEVVRRLIA